MQPAIGARPENEPGNLTVSLDRRAVGLLGLASIGIVLAGAIAAALPYRGYAGEGYSPLNHFISELGEIGVSRLAWVYNLGLVVGGLGLGGFLVMVSRMMSGRIRLVFLAVSVVASLAGAMCGLFPMEYLSTHRLVSGIFFLTGWLVAATFTIWLAVYRPVEFPGWLTSPGVAVVIVFMAFIGVYATYHPADANAHILTRPEVWTVPLLEWAALLSLLAWMACVAATLLRDRAE